MLLGSWRVPVDNIRKHFIGLITRIVTINILSSEVLYRLSRIIEYYDSCGSGCEIGILAGVLTGILVCAKIGAIYPPTSLACMAFMGASAISYEYELANKFVEGSIEKRG